MGAQAVQAEAQRLPTAPRGASERYITSRAVGGKAAPAPARVHESTTQGSVHCWVQTLEVGLELSGCCLDVVWIWTCLDESG
jgi:hypothetical protein